MPTAIKPTAPEQTKIIRGYSDGAFRIDDEVHEGPILIVPGAVLPWPSGSAAELAPEAFAPFADYADALDFILLGTGSTLVFVPPSTRDAVKRNTGLAIEFMDTGAACRTYNMLVTEGRRVGSALVPI